MTYAILRADGSFVEAHVGRHMAECRIAYLNSCRFAPHPPYTVAEGVWVPKAEWDAIEAAKERAEA